MKCAVLCQNALKLTYEHPKLSKIFPGLYPRTRIKKGCGRKIDVIEGSGREGRKGKQEGGGKPPNPQTFRPNSAYDGLVSHVYMTRMFNLQQ
jgi:hypothetical protein